MVWVCFYILILSCLGATHSKKRILSQDISSDSQAKMDSSAGTNVAPSWKWKNENSKRSDPFFGTFGPVPLRSMTIGPIIGMGKPTD